MAQGHFTRGTFRLAPEGTRDSWSGRLRDRPRCFLSGPRVALEWLLGAAEH